MTGLFMLVASATAQKSEIPQSPQVSNTIEQCRNGALASPQVCTGGNWQNGNAGSSNSHYKETDFLPYRGVIEGLAAGSYTFSIGYDILQGNPAHHAIDYLGTYNATETTADPCDSNTLCTLASPTSITPVPTDTVTVTSQTNPNTSLPVTQQPGVITMWGGSLGAASYAAYTAGDEHRTLNITFTTTGGTVVFAFGGHVASQGDWGFGKAAGGISGSPYHTQYDVCSFSCSTHNNSLSAAAITPSATIIVRVAVLTGDCFDFANDAFPFASTAALAAAFNLTDTNANVPSGTCTPTLDPDTFGASVSATVTTFGSTINVSELQSAGGLPGAPFPWSLLRAGCIETGGLTNSTPTTGVSPTININVEPFEVVTCGFVNSAFGITAAPASITGRVTDPTGAALRGVTVTLADVTSGQVRNATTNNFGYYTFNDLTVEDFYRMTVSSRRYLFRSQVRAFTLTTDLANMDFVSVE